MTTVHREDLGRRIQQCLKEAGIDAQVTSSEHEVIVHARHEQEGETLRIVTQISDRDVQPLSNGPVDHQIASARLTQAVVRPTLGPRSATRATRGPQVKLPGTEAVLGSNIQEEEK